MPTEQQKRNREAATFTPDERFLTPEQAAGVRRAQQTVQGLPVITTDALETPQTPLTVPQVPEPRETGAMDFTSLIEQATAIDPLEAEQAKAQATYEALVGRGGRAEFRREREEEVGAKAKREEVTRLAGRSRQLEAEAATLEERLQASVRGRGVTEGGLRPIRTAQQRDLDVRRRFAAADLLAAQGDLQGALDQVNQAVDDEFADREDAITAQQSRIDYLKDQIDRGNIRKTNEMNLRIKQKEREIQQEDARIKEEKDLAKTKFELAVQARGEGLSDSVIRQIQGTETMQDALRVAGVAGVGVQSIRDTKTLTDLQILKARQELTPDVVPGVPIQTAVEFMSVDPSAESIRTYISSAVMNAEMGEGARNELSDTVNLMGALEDFANANPEAGFAGLGAGAGLKRFAGGVATGGLTEFATLLAPESIKQERVANRQAVEGINLKSQIWASGAALTTEQIKQVERLTPQLGDTDRQVRRKVNGLYNFMAQQSESRLLTAGLNNTIPQVDLFEMGSLIDEASPEQLEELGIIR